MTLFHLTNTRQPSYTTEKDALHFMQDYFGDWTNLTPKMYDGQPQGFSPIVDIKENEKAYFVEAELPGIIKDNIDITVKDNVLCIKGIKKSFTENKKEDYHQMERAYGSFYRCLPLPGDADLDKMGANLENGLLSIEIAKDGGHDEKNTRKIDIH
jgi:HSP20 family protein